MLISIATLRYTLRKAAATWAAGCHLRSWFGASIRKRNGRAIFRADPPTSKEPTWLSFSN